MKFCTECGHELKDTAQFCPNCGASVSKDTNDVEQSGNTENSQNTNSQANGVPSVNTEQLQAQALGYGTYFKETLKNPTLGFTKPDWTFSLIQIGIYILLYALWDNRLEGGEFGDYFVHIIINLVMVAVVLGVLFALSRTVLRGMDSFQETTSSFAGMHSLQIILLALAALLGPENLLGVIIFWVFIMQTSNIFNLYLFKNAKDRGGLDGYYQVLLAYVALVVAVFVLVFLILAAFVN